MIKISFTFFEFVYGVPCRIQLVSENSILGICFLSSNGVRNTDVLENSPFKKCLYFFFYFFYNNIKYVSIWTATLDILTYYLGEIECCSIYVMCMFNVCKCDAFLSKYWEFRVWNEIIFKGQARHFLPSPCNSCIYQFWFCQKR